MTFENSQIKTRSITFEGYLLKFTNLVKGYQYRWFIVNNKLGTLDYYEKEDQKHSLKARGCISLVFADVCPSVEDSLTFNINAKSGNYFKLKAQNTKERQEWVNNIRSAISYFNNNLQTSRLYVDNNCGLYKLRNSNECKSFRSTSFLNGSFMSESNFVVNSGIGINSSDDHCIYSTVETFNSFQGCNQDFMIEWGLANRSGRERKLNEINLFSSKPFKNLSSLTAQMDDVFTLIIKNVDSLPVVTCGAGLCAYDKNLLITKATCGATIDCLKNCVTLLRHRRFYHSRLINRKCDVGIRNIWSTNNVLISESKNGTGSVNSLPATINSEEKKVTDEYIDDPEIVSALSIDELSKASKLDVTTNRYPSTNNLNSKFLLPIEGMDVDATNPIDLTEVVEDSNSLDKIQSEVEITSLEENKSLLHHLISQVKLGMDLTKVTLPTFILERRSLLEMFSDYMAHPDLFLRISEGKTPESRIKSLFFWYITSFHAGRKSSIAKKPYNPIIGETFHCMWHVPYNQSTDVGNMPCNHVHFSAEQVSHHPPITAFYVNCPTKSMRLSASIHTKSKFQGMSIVAQMEGKVILNLDDYDEEYQFTLPNAHAKNILSIPKLELGDKVTIMCPKTKYSASLAFHSKTLFGHSSTDKISGEIKDPDNKILYKLSGDWNTILNIEDVKMNNTISTNVCDLKLYNKYVNPTCHQKVYESRRLWHSVTESLRKNDMDKATKYKKELESRQRQSENVRNSKKLQFPVKYFQSTLDGRWIFRNEVSYKTKQCY